MKVESESAVAQSCRTLSDPVDCSLPGSSVHGIFQARILEWGAIAFKSDKNQWKHFMTIGYIKFPMKSIVNYTISSKFCATYSLCCKIIITCVCLCRYVDLGGGKGDPVVRHLPALHFHNSQLSYVINKENTWEMRTVSCPDGHLLVLSALHLPPVLLVFYLDFPLRTFLSRILNCVGEQLCITLHTSDFKTITITKSNDSSTLFEQIRTLRFITHTLLTGFYLGSKWWRWALNSDHLTLSFLPDLVAVSS